jgi:hypothetical protein
MVCLSQFIEPASCYLFFQGFALVADIFTFSTQPVSELIDPLFSQGAIGEICLKHG